MQPYAQLSEPEKTGFLDYGVVVRDLGTVTEEQIKEVFSRINSTDYALKAMERLNALFNGEYNKFCEQLSANCFLRSTASLRRRIGVECVTSIFA